MDETIPLLKQNTLNSFWSAELDELKQASTNAHNLWVLCDEPRQGIINKMRLDAKYKYKLALKHASMNESLEFDDELSNHFLRKDITRLHLVETYCLPLITYGLNCIFVSVSQLRNTVSVGIVYLGDYLVCICGSL